jgi:hypothetical protein
MTVGVVMIAHDSEQISYTKIAAWNAERVRRFTGLPVCLITSSNNAQGFDQVIYVDRPSSQKRYFADIADRVDWTNAGRWQVYDLTPFDYTIVIDADYIVNSDQLLLLANLDQDFLAVNKNYDVTGLHDFVAHSQIGRARLPAYWATVFGFRKSIFADAVFYTWQMVADNWQHYLDLYRINSSLYRNDTALSIALHVASGHSHRFIPAVPWAVATVLPEHHVSLHADIWQTKFVSSDSRVKRVEVTAQDLHIMGKHQLQKIINGIE